MFIYFNFFNNMDIVHDTLYVFLNYVHIPFHYYDSWHGDTI